MAGASALRAAFLFLFFSSITARSDMASRDDQLMVLLNLRCKLPHMSASALAAIIVEFKKSGAPSLGGRKNIRIARENLVNRGTPYGPSDSICNDKNRRGDEVSGATSVCRVALGNRGRRGVCILPGEKVR